MNAGASPGWRSRIFSAILGRVVRDGNPRVGGPRPDCRSSSHHRCSCAQQARVPRAAAADQIEPRSGDRSMAVGSNFWRLASPTASSTTKADEAEDVVFTFYQETWAD